MATKIIVSKEKLDNLANAINTKVGTSGAKTIEELILEVDNFQGGIDTSDATATSGDILLGKTAYVNDVKIEGTIETYDGSIESGAEVDDTVDKIIDGTIAEIKSNAKTIKTDLFKGGGFKNLVKVDLPNLKTIADYAFQENSKLESVNLPNVNSLGYYAFYKCTALKTIELPNVVNVYSGSNFRNCTALTSAKMANLKNISDSMFNGCTALTDLYLGYEGVVTLTYSSSFSNITTNIKVHVRSEYAEQYATATNWSSLITAGRITIVGDYSDN